MKNMKMEKWNNKLMSQLTETILFISFTLSQM